MTILLTMIRNILDRELIAMSLLIWKIPAVSKEYIIILLPDIAQFIMATSVLLSCEPILCRIKYR